MSETSSTEQTYDYAPLPPGFIRLCSLSELEDDASDDLVCRIELHEIDKLPKYDAISYAWQNEPATTAVDCCRGIVWTTPHLRQGLVEIMRNAPCELCWIDQICIDQSNVKEKEEQIPLMQQIYRRATNVVIWLGEPENIWTEKVMTQEMLMPILFKLKLEPPGNHFVGQVGNDPFWQRIAYALRCMKANPWFRRSWVCQETIVSKSVLFLHGKSLVRWELFHETSVLATRANLDFLVATVNDNDPTEEAARYNSMSSINTLRARYVRQGGPAKTDYLIDLIRNTQATKLADKVYCILGLLEPEIASQIVVDYAKPHQEVYLEFARAVITRDPTLSLLSCTNCVTSEAHLDSFAYPSWCPDLTRGAPDLFSFLSFEYSAGFEDPHQQANHVSLLADGMHICVPGFRLGIIEEVGRLRPDVGVPDEDVLLVRMQETSTDSAKWFTDIDALIHRALDSRGLTTNEIQDIIWRVHTAEVANAHVTVNSEDSTKLNVDYGEAFYPICPLLRQGYDTLRGFMSPPSQVDTTDSAAGFLTWMQNLSSLQDLDERATQLSELYMAEFRGFARRRIFRTQNGLVGMGPTTIQEGDVACVLYDASPVNILRPTKDKYSDAAAGVVNQEVFRSVGDGYVHGCMELRKTPKELRDKREIFVIN